LAHGCIESPDKLQVSNLAGVVKPAEQYRNKGLAFEDPINEGSLTRVPPSRRRRRFDAHSASSAARP
jgi:hypothetical protein